MWTFLYTSSFSWNFDSLQETFDISSKNLHLVLNDVKYEMRKRCSVKCARHSLHTFHFFIFRGCFTTFHDKCVASIIVLRIENYRNFALTCKDLRQHSEQQNPHFVVFEHFVMCYKRLQKVQKRLRKLKTDSQLGCGTSWNRHSKSLNTNSEFLWLYHHFSKRKTRCSVVNFRFILHIEIKNIIDQV